MQECLPAPPIPGAPASVRSIPGVKGVRDFYTRAYAALDG
jgi:hypothetical protein